MPTDTWYRHDMKSVRDILITCIGPNFGPNPEEKLEEIRASRYRHGDKICKVLKITGDDVVVDIGSGCGFVTRAACQIAKEVHCVDISQEFLDFTKVELGEFENTRFHKIGYGKFPDIADGTADKVFSTAVFIHFYYYDFLFNLIEVNRILKKGGLFYTEIVDSDVLKLATMRAIKTHVASYKNNRAGARLIQPFSLTALKNLSGQLGFEVVRSTHAADVAEVMLRKTGPCEIPEWLAPIV
ncbi:MAG: class I SAM-dependent methyltransferase [Phycisphaerales bacterium]